MKTNLSIPVLKTWAKKNRHLARAVLAARAAAMVERQRVDAYIVPLFGANREKALDLFLGLCLKNT